MVLSRIALSVVILLGSASQKAPLATVHIHLADAFGNPITVPAVVTTFRSSDGTSFANRFRDGSATGIPYGIYMLRTHATGSWTSEREVRVYQPDVWVIAGLEPGGPAVNYDFSGRVEGLAEGREPVWLRLSGVHLNVTVDAKLSQSTDFRMAEIPPGLYTLVTSRADEILDVRTVEIPAAKSIVIRVHARTAAVVGRVR